MATLSGKSIVVVGGTTGLGLSAAHALLHAGARVVVFGRSQENVAAAQKELGPAAHVFAADAIHPEAADDAIRQCVERFGGFDGLYHVAGGSGRKYGDGPIHELSDQGWEETLRLNLTSVAWSNRAAIRDFLRRRVPGTLLNMSSVLAWSPSPRHFATHAYAAAKSAILGLSRSLASTYAADGIRVNVIAPALVETPMARRAASDPAIQEFIRAKQPLDGGRIGTPADLDAAVVYFMSDAARFTTGQVLAVDGGWDVSDGHFPADPA